MIEWQYSTYLDMVISAPESGENVPVERGEPVVAGHDTGGGDLTRCEWISSRTIGVRAPPAQPPCDRVGEAASVAAAAATGSGES